MSCGTPAADKHTPQVANFIYKIVHIAPTFKKEQIFLNFKLRMFWVKRFVQKHQLSMFNNQQLAKKNLQNTIICSLRCVNYSRVESRI